MRSFASGEVRAKTSSRPSRSSASSSLSLIWSSSAPVTTRAAVARDTDPAGDLERRLPVVAGDDDDPDPGAGGSVATASATSGPGRIEEADEPEQAQVVLGVLAAVGRHGPVRQPAAGDREDAETLGRPAFEHRRAPRRAHRSSSGTWSSAPPMHASTAGGALPARPSRGR